MKNIRTVETYQDYEITHTIDPELPKKIKSKNKNLDRALLWALVGVVATIAVFVLINYLKKINDG